MMTRCHQMTSQQRRSGHPEKQWYLMQERRDSRLISPKSCPTDWVHLIYQPPCSRPIGCLNPEYAKFGIIKDVLGQSSIRPA